MQRIMVGVVLAASLTATAFAQEWIRYPTPGIPRTADGKPNLSAPAPKQPDGKPDLSGLWLVQGAYIGDIAKDLKDGAPMTPWAADLYKHRRDTLSKEDPTGWCVVGGVPRSTAVPYPFKILNTNGMVVILYEAVHSFRQIFTDGRPLPKDPNPQWFGYSRGWFEGDTLVVETTNFRGDEKAGWLDVNGSPYSDALKMTERFRRPNFGTLEIDVTIDDPKAYTKPFTVRVNQRIMVDEEMIEFICNENEKSTDHIKK